VPRDLGDVLHYFFREDAGRPAAAPAAPVPPAPATPRAALPVIATPLSERDVVRAALLWNLAVEVARQGASASVVAPAQGDSSALWPEPGRGPLGAELVLTFADDLAGLARSAFEVAAHAGASARDGGVVLVRVPPAWLAQAADAAALFDWTLLFVSPQPRELLQSYALAKQLVKACPGARIGVTIHGPRSVGEAREAFDRLARTTHRHLDRALTSYGLLVDDVHVVRAIVNRRPLGLAHPHAAATRALQDVARWILLDAAGSARG
jgi:hypothetical protein